MRNLFCALAIVAAFAWATEAQAHCGAAGFNFARGIGGYAQPTNAVFAQRFGAVPQFQDFGGFAVPQPAFAVAPPFAVAQPVLSLNLFGRRVPFRQPGRVVNKTKTVQKIR